MKKLMFILLLAITCLSVTSCKKVKFDESKKELVIGLECDYAPFNWLEMTITSTNYPVDGISGAYAEGYDVQMAKLIAEKLGYTLVIKKIDWDGLIPALESGTIDAIIAGMSPIEERKLKINFTNAYYESTHVLLTKVDSKYYNATKYSDLTNAKVVGQRNTVYDTIASEIHEKNTGTTYLTALESVPLIITAIKSGACDITVLEEPVAKGIVARDSSLGYFKLDEVFTLTEADKIVSIGVRKVDDKLKNKINDALSEISSEKRTELMMQAVDRNAQ